LFSDNPDVAVIIMDGNVPPANARHSDTEGLVRHMRETFRGPMIASSSSPKNQALLKAAGCDYDADKVDVAEKVREILAL